MADYTSIDNPELYFQVKIYSGNGTAIGSGGQAITLDGDEDMQPDLVWIKDRSDSDRPRHFDAVRGVTKELDTSDATAETTLTEGLTAFGSNGFTVGNHEGVNSSSDNFVAWCWKESTTAGFDIVSWSGTGSAKTESHSLSAVPHWIWNKNRADATQHNIYHHKNTSNPETEIIYLNLTNATSDDNGFWNDTAPTSSVFTVGGDNGTNGNSDNMISYLWTAKQGFSKFDKYTGNGSSSANSGTFVFTGFRPSMVMVKSTGSEGWQIWDNKRSSFNGQGSNISPNSANAESTGVRVHFFSNGFQLVSSGADQNSSGQEFLYMSFAEAPFVNSNGVPCNAR